MRLGVRLAVASTPSCTPERGGVTEGDRGAIARAACRGGRRRGYLPLDLPLISRWDRGSRAVRRAPGGVGHAGDAGEGLRRPWEGRAGALLQGRLHRPKWPSPHWWGVRSRGFAAQSASTQCAGWACQRGVRENEPPAHRGLGRTRPSAARVGRAGGDRKVAAPGRLGVNACAVHGQSTAPVLRPSERAPSPHRRQRAAEAAGWLWSGRRWRCWLRGRGADEAASYRSAVRQCRSVSTRRVRRSRVGATRRSPAAAEGFAWLGQRWPSRRGVENLESQDMRPSWSLRCSRMRVKPAAERTQPP